MSDRQNLAEQGTQICLAAVGLIAGGATLAGFAVPAAVLGMIGYEWWSSCDKGTVKAAKKAALEALTASQDISEAEITAAHALLKDAGTRIKFDPERMAKLVEDGTLPDALVREVFPDNLKGEDPGTRTAITLTLEAAFVTFRRNTRFEAAFTQDMVMRTLKAQGIQTRLLGEIKEDTGAIREGQDRVEAEIINVADAMGNIAGANRDLLEALAARFHIEGAFDLPTPTLRAELEKRAEDYRRVLRELDALKGTSDRIDNIHAAAMDAAKNLRLGEAKQLLRDARTILRDEKLRPVIEANAQLMVAEADVELLDQNPDAAAALLEGAAASFAVLDAVEAAKKREAYAETLYAHGLRYGGTGLARAIDLRRAALATLTEADHPLQWATTTQNLAVALRTQGSRTEGAAGTALLAEAVTAYRAALRVRTEADHPLDWAMTTQNLALALQTQGTRTDGPAGTALLAEAVTAFRAALRVRTEADHPLNWATTTQNLAIALETQGSRTDGAAGTALLAEAVTAFRAALRVFTEADHPLNWATTIQNLAIALRNQGSRTDGAAGTDLLAEAVTAYRAALRVTTEADHPLDWATTTQNLANALATQGIRTDGAAGTALLDEAVIAYGASLRVLTKDDHPNYWAQIKENLALAEQAIADHAAADDPLPHLRAALAHLEAALTVYDSVHTSFYYEKASRLRGDLIARLDAAEGED